MHTSSKCHRKPALQLYANWQSAISPRCSRALASPLHTFSNSRLPTALGLWSKWCFVRSLQWVSCSDWPRHPMLVIRSGPAHESRFPSSSRIQSRYVCIVPRMSKLWLVARLSSSTRARAWSCLSLLLCFRSASLFELSHLFWYLPKL